MTKPSLLPLVALGLLLSHSPTEGQTIVDRIGSAVVSLESGGSVKISKGMRTVSARSSLELNWFMVADSTLGLVFDQPVGARGEEDNGWFHYRVDIDVRALQPVKAFEVRVLTFNVWGDFTGTLAFTQLEDLESDQQKKFERRWGYLGEAPLRAHGTSVAYVARVILDDGSTIEADPAPALAAAQRIQASITVQDLEPVTEPIPVLPRG